jgi:hypothetical protein
MDINPQTTQSISDDQELAKVLAGVTQEPEAALQFEETPVVGAAPAADAALPTTTIGYNPPASTEPAASTDVVVTPAAAGPSSELESIKNEALSALRPLVDKLDLAADEKFDTYLLLLRSTDDKALIAPAYAAAQAITDESRKAQALLDVIKEIDFLTTQQ